MRAVTLTAALLMLVGPAAEAGGPIERACNRSDRAAATREMCHCLQRVADATLRRREQRTAAGFFRDPDRAQEVRRSDTARDDAFWERYLYFGKAAELNCG
jgi:hypothetical protein